MPDSSTIVLHPTAVVHPDARIAAGCRIGPHAVIDAHVELGEGCDVGPLVHLTGHTRIGARNRFHAGAVIGDAPQDFKYDGSPARLRIGDDNVFREHVTVHRSNKTSEDTVIGNSNFLMAGCHVGHNCEIGNHNIIANGALLAGHVQLADRVFVSGTCVVHQSCRIGRLALMQGGSGISKDLPRSALPAGTTALPDSTRLVCGGRALVRPTACSCAGPITACFVRSSRVSPHLLRPARNSRVLPWSVN